jgi:O-phosphoseryl-tRNA synthetase
VKDGDIFGVQNNDDNNELKGGQHTNIRYLDAFSKLVGSTIESKIADKLKKKAVEINIGIIKEMEDINLQLDGGALRYLLTNNKKIDVRGPMFINVECKLVLPGAKNNKVKNH